ncbi:MAG: hypothetical protein IJ860_07915 [Eubacterium sp.]|nr:hypothetical protein [Eubacterium sp.]
MAVQSFWRQTITRLRPAEKTERGSKVYDWSNPGELDIPGCSVQPSSTSLSQDGRVLGVQDGLTVYAPVDADVRAGDRIRFNGSVYAINGDPLVWPGVARMEHMQLNLQRWRG